MKKGAVISLILAWQSPSFAMTLQEYLKAVEANNKSVQSLQVSTEAVELAKDAGDIELVPVLTAEAGYINDKSPLSQFALLGSTETKTTSYSLGLGKKFSTGTMASITASTYEIENTGIQGPQAGTLQKFGVGSLGVGLSQSLWKDFFGNATRLRWERQEASTAAAAGRFDLQKKLLLVNAEAAYWDYIYANDNLKISQASLERARRIEAWTRRRVNDGISDRADLLSAQALVSARQLQLISAEDDMAAAKRNIRDYLEYKDDKALPEITGNISERRSLTSMVDGGGSGGRRVMALDAYLASLDAKAKALESRETEDQLRPDLVLSGSYNTNAVEKDMPEATQNWTDTERPTTKVGLKLTYPFDMGPKNAAREAARKSALASKLQSERKMLESESSWIELNRRYLEMSKRIEAATEISRLQSAAAKAQTDLFNKGRSITANVITAEEDAGTAELNLSKLKSEQRKMEAQGRLFIVVEEK
ncbi:TolC family protein [Bdellovibrio sp. BCCA]|uniref:TolC family protein n=1 Tax=Bdellovibrio sp. BCCA TaxID=3136281 RepID=UPI0030EFCEED